MPPLATNPTAATAIANTVTTTVELCYFELSGEKKNSSK